MSLRVAPIDAGALSAVLPGLARLRISVFRTWPYLYDGDLAYEERYLARLAASPGACLVAAWDGQRLVGAATGAPMEDHAREFAEPLRAAGHDPGTVFYCAESVLLPVYRGQGAGHAFFDHRESHARSLGRKFSAFCAVIRPPDHPARPVYYAPLDPFWRRRGYSPVPGAIARFAWRDLGDADETGKPMQLWLRPL